MIELGDLRNQVDSSPAGLIGLFRRRRLARQRAGLESRRAELRAWWAELLPEHD